MSEVRPQDILLRVGGRTLQRYGVLAVAGAGRSLTELVESFSRAHPDTFIDRDGIVRRAAANNIGIEYPPALSNLVDESGYRHCGPILNGSRGNLCIWSDALSNWTSTGTPLITDAFATLGDLSLTLIEDDDAAGTEYKTLGITFAGDAVKAVLFNVRAPTTPADGNSNRLKIRDLSVPADRLLVDVTWNTDGTLATATASVGTVITTKKLGMASGLPVYAIYCQTTSITAANSHQVQAYPAGESPSLVGKMLIGGVDVGNYVFPRNNRIRTVGSVVTLGADSLTVPFNFGPMDLTVLARVARPIHADVTGSLPDVLGIYLLGAEGTSAIVGRFETSSRVLGAYVDDVTVDAGTTQAIPAGDELKFCAQYRSFPTGRVKLDVGSGFGSEGGPTSPGFSSFTNQTLLIGSNSPGGGNELYGVLLDLIIARGLLTLNEMLAVR